MKTNPVIVLTGGGSGGHITPLLSLAHALKQADPKCRIIYIGLRGEKLEGLQERYKVFDQVCTVPSGKFRRYHGQSFLAHLIDIKTLLLNIKDFFRVIWGVFVARRLLKKLKPGVVFSKGSFVAVPVGIAAHWQKIAIITHDSDATAGLANRIVGRWARVNATGMPAQNYSYPKDKTVYVGIPIDERIKPVSSEIQQAYKKQLGLPKNSLVLLIGGAGLGSKSLNERIGAIAGRLLHSFGDLYILHLTGTMHEDEIKRQYAKLLGSEERRRVRAEGFTPEFYKYSGAADLVVTRAGATTLAELALQKKATLLVPAPFLTAGQQLKNAQQLKKAGAVEVMDDESSAEDMYNTIDDLLKDSKKRSGLAAKIADFAKDGAAKDLADIILKTARDEEHAP